MFLSLCAAVTTFLVPLPLLLLLSFGMTAQLPMKSLFWLRTRQVQGNSPGLASPCWRPRLHWQLCCHSQRQQQQQWTRHKEGCHGCPQAEKCPAERALEDPCRGVRCQWLQPPRDCPTRGVYHRQTSQ